MNSMLEALAHRAPGWLNGLVAWEAQILVLVLILLGVERAIPAMSPRVRHSLWLAVLARAMVPPFVPWPDVAASVPVLGATAAAIRAALPDAGASAMSPLPVAVLAAWLALSLAVAAIALARALSLRVVLRNARPLEWPEDGNLRRLAGDTRLLAADLASPLTLGIRRPRVYVTPELVTGDTRDLVAVLYHELAHVRRRDSWVVLLQTVALALHPFPHLRALNARLTRDRELICDGHALDHASLSPARYGRMLLACVERAGHHGTRTGGAACFVETRRALEDRFRELGAYRRGRLARLTVRQRALVATALLALVPLMIQPASGGDENTSGPSHPGNKAEDFTYTHPVPVRQVSPSYPAAAREQGREGTVLVKVLISEEGRVAKTEIASCTTPGVGFEEAAAAAAAQWTFQPATDDGKPVPVWIAIPFRFELDEGSKPGAEAGEDSKT